MKKIISLFVAILFLTSCEKESVENGVHELKVDPGITKTNGVGTAVCHKNGVEIAIGEAAVDTHIAHGDAVDMDGDGFYDIENPCSATDCDDTNPEVNPDAVEVPYDGIDNDCNPETLDDDLDQDGFNIDVDCDDTNPEVNPGVEEICGNGIDDNCDGQVDEDCIPIGPTDVYNPTTGKVWMDRNLGATQVARFINDVSSGGDIYQWGRGTDGHQIRTSATTTTLSNTDVPGHGNFIINAISQPLDWRSPKNDNLWQGVTGVNNPCPAGYRIPTMDEWNKERLSWSSNNSAGAFASPLKLPSAGFRRMNNNGLVIYGAGIYWSSTVTYYGGARRLAFVSGGYNDFWSVRADGHSCRCIKD